MMKLCFFVGFGLKIFEVNGMNVFLQVCEMLGQFVVEVLMVEVWVYGMEVKGMVVNGFYVFDCNMLYGLQVVMQ